MEDVEGRWKRQTEEGFTGSKHRCQPPPLVVHKAQDQERCALVTRNLGSEPGLSALQQCGWRLRLGAHGWPQAGLRDAIADTRRRLMTERTVAGPTATAGAGHTIRSQACSLS